MCGESATEREPVTSHRKKRLHLGCEDRDTQLGEIKSTATALPEVFAGRGRVDRSGMPSFLLYRTGDGRHCIEQMNEEGEGRWQPRRTGKKGSEVGKGGEGRPLNRHPDHHRHRRRVALSPIPSSLRQFTLCPISREGKILKVSAPEEILANIGLAAKYGNNLRLKH